MAPDLLVLVLPIFELGPRASEDDPLAGDAPRADLAGVEVLDDVRRDQRGEHEDADGRVRVVADLVRALLAARERYDVALAQLLLALVRAQRRLAAEDDRPFLVRVVGVKWPLLVTRLGVGVRADPSVLEAPALALFRAIPLVCVEIEDLHAASSLVARFGCYRTAGKQLPVPLGDDFDGAVDYFDGGLVVDRIRRPRQAGGPPFGSGHGVCRQVRVFDVREDRKIDHAQRSVSGRRMPVDEVLPDPR